MVITIDGPAGAGKSTAARRLAAELGFRFLDTGAMYRAVTWAVLERGVDPHDEAAVGSLVESIEIHVDGGSIAVDGCDVSAAIRAPRVAAAISPVADNPRVRARLTALQRTLARSGDFVCEGRDQGTEVFPDAICKFFLTATPPCRAARRQEELRRRGVDVPWQDLLAQQAERDRRDATRIVGRLIPAEDAIQVATDHLTLDEVVAVLKSHVLKRLGRDGA